MLLVSPLLALSPCSLCEVPQISDRFSPTNGVAPNLMIMTPSLSRGFSRSEFLALSLMEYVEHSIIFERQGVFEYVGESRNSWSCRVVRLESVFYS